MATGFPDYYEEKIIVTPLMVIAGVPEVSSVAGVAGAGAWPVANMAFFVPRTTSEALTFKRMALLSGTSAANYDIGIYDTTGKRLVSSGSQVKGITQQAVVYDIIDTLLAAGRYYWALALDSALGDVLRWAVHPGLNTLIGVREMAAAFPLPATAVFSENNARNFIPVIGATLQAA